MPLIFCDFHNVRNNADFIAQNFLFCFILLHYGLIVRLWQLMRFQFLYEGIFRLITAEMANSGSSGDSHPMHEDISYFEMHLSLGL